MEISQSEISQFDSWVGNIHWRRDMLPTPVFLGFPCSSAGKESSLQCGRPGFDPWVGKIPWRREKLPTPVFWPGEFQSMGVTKSWTWLSDLHFHPHLSSDLNKPPYSFLEHKKGTDQVDESPSLKLQSHVCMGSCRQICSLTGDILMEGSVNV